MYAKMHFGIKCILASNAFVTFCVTKCTHQMHFCTAEHFPLENVRVAKMHFCIKCILTFCIASNAFVTFCVTKCTHQMHFCIKCIFANQNVRRRQNAVFFALQKTKAVRCVALPKCILAFLQNAFFLWKMFSIKKENVQQTKMLESGKMHLMQKCIFATQRVHFPKENVALRCKNAFLHQMHL